MVYQLDKRTCHKYVITLIILQAMKTFVEELVFRGGPSSPGAD
jgi:hypothetical protein